MKRVRWMAAAIAAAIAASGCGRPPTSGGPPSGPMPLQAVVALAVGEPVADRTSLVGSLEAVEYVDLVSEVAGELVAIGFAEGGPVEEGAELFRFDDSKLEARRKESEARYRLAQANRERSRELLANNTISQQEYDQADANFLAAEAALDLAREEVADSTVRAPFAGVMTERHVSRGQIVDRGALLASLVQIDPIELAFQVPGRFLARLDEGRDVEFHSDAWPEQTFAGRVTFVSPRVDPSTRSVPVKARVANPDGKLRPGMYGIVDLVFSVAEDAVTVPIGAVRLNGGRATVVVMNGDGTAEFRPVTTGVRLADRVHVVSGVAAGERVVVDGHQKMGPGTRVIIAPESAAYGVDPPDPSTEIAPSADPADRADPAPAGA